MSASGVAVSSGVFPGGNRVDPVLSFYVVDSEDEAIQLANATRYGLGSYVIDADVDHSRQVATRIAAIGESSTASW